MNNDDAHRQAVPHDGTSTGTGRRTGEPGSHRRSTAPGTGGRHGRTAQRGGIHRAVNSGPRSRRRTVLLAVAATIAAGCCSLALIRAGSGPDQELAANRSMAAPPTKTASTPSASHSAAPSPQRHKASASPSGAERHGKRHTPQRPRKARPESGSKTTVNTPPRTSRTEAGARADAPAAPRAATGTAAQFAQKVVDLVNDQRARHGCGPLTVDPRLRNAAQAHSDDMAARNYYEHNSPEGVDPGTRMTRAGFRWSSWAENIFKSPKDPATALKGWMDSPGHRSNILNCSYKFTGVGVNLSSNGPWWTQDFATRS
ncbi:CAP domain-containing protein [Streptomyces sp. NPDC058989]|uniref:CAP domain-containing protein n=1 Tax=Streptomyces sp. NPDC058989 TaxID=3346686 RepID=UPI0036BCECA5